MKFKALTVFAAAAVVALSSCKKDKPSYCTEDLFQEAFITDAGGAVTTTFSPGASMNLDMYFINTAGDSLELTYSEPWVTYEVYSGGQLVAASGNPNDPTTGVGSLVVHSADTVKAPHSFPSGFPVGNYTLKAKATYQFVGCESGIRSKESVVEFKVE